MSTKEKAAVIVACILAILAVIAVVVLEEPTDTADNPPMPPEEVLSVWQSPPSPQGVPPILLGEATLTEYGEQSSRLEMEPFFLQNAKWIDIVVESKKLPVSFLEREPGQVSFRVHFEYSDSGYWPDREDLEKWDANPFLGRILYQQQTETDTGTVYTIAVRLFAEGEIEDGNWLGCHCTLAFENFQPNLSASISYEIYELARTPGWGWWNEESYANAVLYPWILQHTSSESEAEQMLVDWMEQFRLT